MVVGPRWSGKTSFIKTFINYKFSFQRIIEEENIDIYIARKIIKDTEFEIEFIDFCEEFMEEKDWSDKII